MNHSVILPHLIRCQGEPKSDRPKPEGKGTPQNLVKPLGADEIFKSFCEVRFSVSVISMKITPLSDLSFTCITQLIPT